MTSRATRVTSSPTTPAGTSPRSWSASSCVCTAARRGRRRAPYRLRRSVSRPVSCAVPQPRRRTGAADRRGARAHSGGGWCCSDGVADRTRPRSSAACSWSCRPPSWPELRRRRFHVHQFHRAARRAGRRSGRGHRHRRRPRTGRGSLLVVRRPAGHDALVPFVGAIVPTVDSGGRTRRPRPARRACSTPSPTGPSLCVNFC
ncbi:hypothetical protein HBB16_08770 [Pseudonocardia sp. MCCB 268]|nr:hypothetical protein [Pseudonocardia cytotoxica]